MDSKLATSVLAAAKENFERILPSEYGVHTTISLDNIPRLALTGFMDKGMMLQTVTLISGDTTEEITLPAGADVPKRILELLHGRFHAEDSAAVTWNTVEL